MESENENIYNSDDEDQVEFINSFKNDKAPPVKKQDWNNLTEKINEQFDNSKKRINWFKVVYVEQIGKKFCKI